MKSFPCGLGRRALLGLVGGRLRRRVRRSVPIIREFLSGAREIDTHFAQAPLEENLPFSWR